MLQRCLNSNVFFFIIEMASLVVLAGLSWALPLQRWIAPLLRTFYALGDKKLVAVVVTMLAAVAGRLIILPLFPVPVPGVHDEYSYLLNGATFAAGRLANSPTPVWRFFESFHIIQQPTYASMYPVAPGLFLALGFLAHLPWIGVLLSVALFCGAVTWALQGWLPGRYALLGGMIAVLKFGLVSYWIDSYWGGAVPALGGALVTGAIPRLMKRINTWDGIALGIGFLLLANSRPFEGFIFAIVAAIWFVVQKAGQRRGRISPAFMKAMIPGACVLLGGLIAMAVYFKATTGDPLKMPYTRYSEQYAITRAFIWQPTEPEPHFDHAVMRRYYERELPLYRNVHTLRGWSTEEYRKLSAFMMFYLWPGVLLILVALPFTIRKAEGLFAWISIVTVMAGVGVEVWRMMLHYPSPVAASTLLLMTSSIRTVSSWKVRGRLIGVGIACAVPLVCTLGVALRVAAAAYRVPVPDHGLVSLFTVDSGNLDRERIVTSLNRTHGKHLIVVRYAAAHDLSKEWVYNGPSLPDAHILWAREMSPRDTSELVRFFPDRIVWLLRPDETPLKLTPYPGTGPATLSSAQIR